MPGAKKKYDLIVIGGGSGGLAHAQRASEHGMTAAVIENGPLGGPYFHTSQGVLPLRISAWLQPAFGRSEGERPGRSAWDGLGWPGAMEGAPASLFVAS